MTVSDRHNDIDEKSILAALGESNSIDSPVRRIIESYGLTKELFTSARYAETFEKFMAKPSIHKGDSMKLLFECFSNEDIDPILEHLQEGDVAHFDRLVRDFVHRRRKEDFARGIQKVINEDMGSKFSPDVMAYDVRRMVEKFFNDLNLKPDEFCSIADLADPGPEDKDDNCLLAGRFLEKGGALGLISVSGAGKSVLSLQLAYGWALGRETLGLRPYRALKICVFQTEDSPADMVDFRKSIREGFRRFHNWSEEDIAAAEKNLTIARCEGMMDDEFFRLLGKGQLAHNFDLLIINPLSGICSGNLSDNTEMTELLCKKIDPILRNKGHECGLLIVHHTNKPSNNPSVQPFGSDANTQYALSGANKITGWLRAILTLLPTKEKGQYRFIASKRGGHLGWPESGSKDAMPTRYIRQSTQEEGIMFWHDLTPSDPTTSPSPAKPCLTREDRAEALAAELRKHPRSLTEARNLARNMFKRTAGDEAYNDVERNPPKYSLVCKEVGSTNKKIIGAADAVKNL